MAGKRYFADKKKTPTIIIGIILALLFIFSVFFFLWSVMRYNEIEEQKKEKEEYILELSNNIDKLEYLVDAPLDDEYKIRVAREKLGMCFPDEIIYHTEYN